MKRDPLQDAYRALQHEGSSACPSDDELAGLVVGDVDDARRALLADHVVSCRRCTESAAILFETHRETSGAGRAAPIARRLWFSLAAAAAALVVVGLLVARPGARAPAAERGASGPSAGVVPPDGAALDEPPTRFEWPTTAEAESYRLELYRDSGELVWDGGRQTDTRAPLPAAARARLSAGAYYWVVEIEGPLGKTRSGPFSFRVGRR